jgi:3-deoxy-manno-octulosonate cytidylyltransferase (CMP-KDO synthetase)
VAKLVAVIPVRFGSQRFPGKPITPILGRPMVQWVIEGVRQSQLVDQIIVATDNDSIALACQPLGVEVIMTPPDLATGTDRVHWAVANVSADYVINIQGDEPLINGAVIDKMAQVMLSQNDWEMVTLGHPITPEELLSPNTAKIVMNHKNQAIYFSRFPIPYSREKSSQNPSACLKHIGIYGYKREFLEHFCQTPSQPMELMEGLEQLRALYLGARIPVVEVDYKGLGVDTPDDVPVVEEMLRKIYGR